MRHFRLLVVLASVLPLALEAQDPSGRIYVRRIEFLEVTGINDEVLRRELLQLEGTYLNTVALERSRLRLEQLPYVERAQVHLRPVEGSPDVVDVVITITEAPWRRYGGGGAYSESLRTSLHGYFVNENLWGTGQQLSYRAEGSSFRALTTLSHTQPYATAEGVSRTVELSSLDIDRLTADASALDAELSSLRMDYGLRLGRWPLETRLVQPEDCCNPQTLRLGIDLRRVELSAGEASSNQLLSWVAGNGESTTRNGFPATVFRELGASLQWHYDSRDRQVFPRRGLEQDLSVRVALPGSEVEYYLIDYDVVRYWSLGELWTASLRGRLGFGAGYGDTSSIPPYLNRLAGGPRSVRGYRENALGPRDSFGNPYGGDLLIAGQFEIMTPWPRRWASHLRVGFFYDVGNVFSTESVSFRDDAGRPIDYGFSWSALRNSIGIAAQLVLPPGTLRLSYAVPLDARDDEHDRFIADDLERFQISLGVEF